MAHRSRTRAPTIAPVSSLTMTDESNDIIADYVSGVLECIEAQAQTAVAMQIRTISTDLPRVVSAPPLTDRVAVQRVWYGIIRELESKGYNPELIEVSSGTQVRVTLVSQNEARQSESIDQYLSRFVKR